MKYTMEILQGIIEDNIYWFWNNDPMVDYETNIDNLWKGFKLWCVQNCLEIVNVNEDIVAKAVDDNYYNWKNEQII